MTTERLFDERPRDDARYLQPGETSFSLLDRTSRPELAWPRRYLDEWFAAWPADGREELRGRLFAKDQPNIDGAFWELYLHEAHRRLGYTLTREPEIPTGLNRPDFLVERDVDSFYLEATVLGPSSAAAARQKREELVVQAVNNAYNPDFCIRLRSVTPGAQQASPRAITQAVEEWMSTLEWEAEHARSLAGNARGEPHHLEVQGTHLFLLPWPRAPAFRGDQSFPTVISSSGGVGVVNEASALVEDLKAKARQFGKLDRPYVVAVLVTRELVFPHDVPAALFGPEVVRIPVGPGGPVGDPTLARDPRAFWIWGQEERGTRVSAVLVAFHIHPWSLSPDKLKLWRSPWPTHPLEHGLPWATVDVDRDTGSLVERPGTIQAASLFQFDEPSGD